jgi:hypothetical protein
VGCGLSRERPANAVIRPGVSRLPRPVRLIPLVWIPQTGPWATPDWPTRSAKSVPPSNSGPSDFTRIRTSPCTIETCESGGCFPTIGARNQCRIPCEWVTATCGAARSAQIATAAAQIKANARTRARNLVIHCSDHRLGPQRGAACRARHTFLARYRRVISIDYRKCFFFSHEKAGSQPGATSVAVKLQSPAWGRRVQSLSTDGDMAGPPNASILALEAQAAQSGRSCSEFRRSRPARRAGARHGLIHFFQERTAEEPVLHSFCCLCHLWSGELDRTRKKREFRISCFAEVSFKGIRLSAIAHSTHRADLAPGGTPHALSTRQLNGGRRGRFSNH